MRSFDEIKSNTQVQVGKDFATIEVDMQGFLGYLRLRDSKHTMDFVCTIDEMTDGTKWEHVSVSYHGETRKTPSWAEMCAVKEIFWDKEEEVHQIHPKESQYVHGFKEKQNILHLWRPVNGWVGFEE
jgi:hypothetical protein